MAHKRDQMKLYMIESQYSQHGYDFTRIEIKPGGEDSLASLAAKYVDNAIGYDNPASAEKEERKYRWLMRQGYIGEWFSSWQCEPFDLEWQHYKPYDSTPATPHTYCEVSIRLGRKIGDIRSGMKLFERILAKAEKLGHSPYATLQDPKYIRDTLARMGAVPLTRVTVPPDATGYSFNQTELCTSRVLTSVLPLAFAS